VGDELHRHVDEDKAVRSSTRSGGRSSLSIREATADDVVLLRTLIVELAQFERETAEIRTTEADLLRDGFGGNPRFRAVIAEWQEKTAGIAVYFPHYSTWPGKDLR